MNKTDPKRNYRIANGANSLLLSILCVAIASVYTPTLFYPTRTSIHAQDNYLKWKGPKVVSSRNELEDGDFDHTELYIFPCQYSTCNQKERQFWQLKIYEEVWNPSFWFEDPVIVHLCESLLKRDFELADQIIENGDIDINASGKEGMTVLFWSIFCDFDQIEYLLQKGFSPDFLVKSNCRLLVFICGEELPELNDNSFIGMLTYLSFFESDESTHRLRDLVKLILKYGADPNFKSQSLIKYSPNFKTHDQFSLIRLLIVTGIDIQMRPFPTIYLGLSDYLYEETSPYVAKCGFFCDLNTEAGLLFRSHVYHAFKDFESSPVQKRLNEVREDLFSHPDRLFLKSDERKLLDRVAEIEYLKNQYKLIMLRQGVQFNEDIVSESLVE